MPILLGGSAGCLDASDEASAGDVASASSAIVNGTAVAPAGGGHVFLGNCSGELLRNRWVLTARHCVVDLFAPGRSVTEEIVRTSGSFADPGTHVDQIILHPEGGLDAGARLDLALVHLTAPIAIRGDSTSYLRELYSGTLASLNGKALQVFGYSPTVIGGSDHDLHTATLTASQAQAEDAVVQWINLAENAAGQMIWHGDSGGGSYLSGQLVGINCCLNGDHAAWQTALNGVRGWILNRVGAGNQGTLAWEPITTTGPGSFAAPSVVALGDRQLRVFTVSGTIAYYGRYDALGDATWHWLDFGLPGGVGTTAITALTWGGSRLDVISRGSDARLYHSYSNDGGGAWSTWESLGGPSTSAAPEVVSSAPGRLDVFAASSSGQLAHWWTSNAPWASETLAGSASGRVSAVAFAGGRLNVFARGASGQLSHWYYPAGAGFGYESLATGLAGAPRVVTSGAGRLDVFAVDTSAQLERWSYADASGWTAPVVLGGGFKTQQPGAVSWAPSRLDVFASLRTGGIVHAYANGGAFSGFEDWGDTATDVSVASAGVGSLYAFHGGTVVATRLYY